MSALLPDLLTASTVVVTGGAGFIGSNIAEVLSRDPSNSVIVVDDLSTGSLSNLDWSNQKKNVVFHRLDVCSTRKLARIMGEGADVVLHHAAKASVQASLENPCATNRVNVQGTLSCLRACVKAGVQRFIFASSCAAYGDRANPPLKEDAPAKPTSPYGVSKLAGENYCRVFHELYDIHTVSLRYFNVYGPRQNPDSEYSAVIPRFIKLMSLGVRPTIYGDGEQTRDFVFVGDVIRANCLATRTKRAAGQTYNVASGMGVSVNRLAGILAKKIGFTFQPIYEAPRPGDIRHSWADLRKAELELGFRPVYPLERGLEQTISHYLKERHG